jgi:hypothetical protein
VPARIRGECEGMSNLSQARILRGRLFPATLMEDDMTEMEMTDEVETEMFTDDLSDEALDREPAGEGKYSTAGVGCWPAGG